MILAQPWWLVSLAAAAIPALFAVCARRRGRRVGTASVVLQCLSVAAAGLALARPAVPLGEDIDKPYLVLQDVSASTRGQATLAPDWPADVPRETYDFAAELVLAGEATSDVDTNISPALRLAAAMSQPRAGVVICTDGQFSDDDWPAAAAALGRTGLQVHILPMESPPADVRIAELLAGRGADGRVKLRLTVASNSAQRRTVLLQRSAAGNGGPSIRNNRDMGLVALLRRTLDLLPNDSATLRLTDMPPPDRSAVYRAVLLPADAFVENDSAWAIATPLTRRAAVVARQGTYDAAALAEQLDFDLTPVPPGRAPLEAAGWAQYAAVVLVDAEGTLLSRPQRTALAEFVRRGGGLLLLGAGPHGGPADRADPLNQIAALVANPYQRRPMKLIVVLDASGSMAQRLRSGPGRGHQVKFDVAVEAVMSLRRHLTKGDSLAVITFSSRATRAYDSGSGPADFAALRDALEEVRPSGPTDVAPALREATRLPPPGGREGLVLLVSDLMTKPFEPAMAAAWFTRSRFSLAVVATAGAGDFQPATVPLNRLAAALGAPVVRRDRLGGLATVFARFLRGLRGEATRHGRFQATADRTPFGVPSTKLPHISAYILSAPQEQAEVLLRVGTDAVLAARRAGLGRSICLALPLAKGHNAAWATSPAANALLAEALRQSLRDETDPRFTGRVRRYRGACTIRVEARDGEEPLNLLMLRASATVADPAAPVEPIALRQVAPGRYEARIDAPESPFDLVVREESGRVIWREAFSKTYPREFGSMGPDWPALRRLAELTGGRIIGRRELADMSRQWTRLHYRSIWPYLLAAAVVFMLIEWSRTRTDRLLPAG